MSECHCCACCGEGEDVPCAKRIRALEAERDALKAALTDPGIPHRPIGHGPGTCPRCEVLEAAFAVAKPSPPPAPETHPPPPKGKGWWWCDVDGWTKARCACAQPPAKARKEG